MQVNLILECQLIIVIINKLYIQQHSFSLGLNFFFKKYLFI